MSQLSCAVVPLFNQTHGHRFDHFEPGDELKVSRYGMIFTGSVTEILDRAYAYFNRDDRPNGQSEPSVSAGDLLRLMDNGELVGYWSVDRPAGFTPVPKDQVMRGKIDWNHPSGIERDMERLARENRGLDAGYLTYVNGEVCSVETGERC